MSYFYELTRNNKLTRDSTRLHTGLLLFYFAHLCFTLNLRAIKRKRNKYQEKKVHVYYSHEAWHVVFICIKYPGYVGGFWVYANKGRNNILRGLKGIEQRAINGGT